MKKAWCLGYQDMYLQAGRTDDHPTARISSSSPSTIKSLTLLPITPRSLHAYWIYDDAGMKRQGTDYAFFQGKLLLRLHQLSASSENKEAIPESVAEKMISPGRSKCYLDVQPNCQYMAEIGEKDVNGLFLPWARSNTIRTPRESALPPSFTLSPVPESNKTEETSQLPGKNENKGGKSLLVTGTETNHGLPPGKNSMEGKILEKLAFIYKDLIHFSMSHKVYHLPVFSLLMGKYFDSSAGIVSRGKDLTGKCEERFESGISSSPQFNEEGRT